MLPRLQWKCFNCSQILAKDSFGSRRIRVGALFSYEAQSTHEVPAASVTEPNHYIAICGSRPMVTTTCPLHPWVPQV